MEMIARLVPKAYSFSLTIKHAAPTVLINSSKILQPIIVNPAILHVGLVANLENVTLALRTAFSSLIKIHFVILACLDAKPAPIKQSVILVKMGFSVPKKIRLFAQENV